VLSASGWVLSPLPADVKILAVSAASALSAIIGALLVARFIIRPIDRLRAVARRLADGELAARVTAVERPAELADLAVAFHEMAAGVEQTFAARRQLV